MTTFKQVVGRLGEDLVGDFYKREGFKIIDKNYLRKWGEIDLIASKDNKIYFIEVKTVTRSYICNPNREFYRPEDNVHLYKAQRLKRTIQTYLLGIREQRTIDWQFDLVTVILNKEDLSLIDLKRLENLIL